MWGGVRKETNCQGNFQILYVHYEIISGVIGSADREDIFREKNGSLEMESIGVLLFYSGYFRNPFVHKCEKSF